MYRGNLVARSLPHCSLSLFLALSLSHIKWGVNFRNHPVFATNTQSSHYTQHIHQFPCSWNSLAFKSMLFILWDILKQQSLLFLSSGSRQNRAEGHTPDLLASQDGPEHQGPRLCTGGSAQTPLKTVSAWPWAILNLWKLWPSLGARIFPAVVTNVVDSKLVSFLVHSLPILPTKPLFVVILLTWKRLASSHVRFTHSEKQAEWQWLFLHVLQMSSAC